MVRSRPAPLVPAASTCNATIDPGTSFYIHGLLEAGLPSEPRRGMNMV